MNGNYISGRSTVVRKSTADETFFKTVFGAKLTCSITALRAHAAPADVHLPYEVKEQELLALIDIEGYLAGHPRDGMTRTNLKKVNFEQCYGQ